MGMSYVNWRLDYFLTSGVNEGHMYDSLAIDDIVVSLYTLLRVTGYEGPFVNLNLTLDMRRMKSLPFLWNTGL